jgi:nitrate reductase NapE component
MMGWHHNGSSILGKTNMLEPRVERRVNLDVNSLGGFPILAECFNGGHGRMHWWFKLVGSLDLPRKKRGNKRSPVLDRNNQASVVMRSQCCGRLTP